MTKFFSAKRFMLKALVIALLIVLAITATPSAQTSYTVEDYIRDDMMLIAERYATHVWTATGKIIQVRVPGVDAFTEQ